MSRRGNCWDNAVVESFFATLKTELVQRCSFVKYFTNEERTRVRTEYLNPEEAQQSIFEYIEVFYNRQRRHSTLGYRTPAEFEQFASAT